MRVKYIGESCKDLETGKYYEVDYNINPRYIWVAFNGVEKTYKTLTDLLLDWDLVNRNKLNESFENLMFKLP